MRRLTYTLISDGATDANLIPIVNWTLKERGGVSVANGTRAEFWRLATRPSSLDERITKAMELYPCDALFIHRDAEGVAHGDRVAEIRTAVELAARSNCRLPSVGIVPVRMTEAWLLWNEEAIREAAGNPNGRSPLDLPPFNKLETRTDPKKHLRDALRQASELRGRRLKKFNESQAVWRIVDFLSDFSALRNLSAFVAFEDAIAQMRESSWSPGFYPRRA